MWYRHSRSTHSLARVASEKWLEQLGEALEMDLDAHGVACPTWAGLETVEEQRVEAAVNLPQRDLIGRLDRIPSPLAR
jgi:hypothetical protein